MFGASPGFSCINCCWNLTISLLLVAPIKIKRAQAQYGDRWWVGLRGGSSFIEDAVATMRGYQVCMAFENSNLEGYVTEKLPAAFFAGCVPIYWGHQSVFQIFNKDAFIYAGNDPKDLPTIRRAVALAIEVGKNPTGELARSYLAAPKLNQEDPQAVWERFFQWEPEEERGTATIAITERASILGTIRRKILALAAAPQKDVDASLAAMTELINGSIGDGDGGGKGEGEQQFNNRAKEEWLAHEEVHTLEFLISTGQRLLKSGGSAVPVFEAALVRLRQRQEAGYEGEGAAAAKEPGFEAKIRMSLGRALHLRGRNDDAASEFEAARTLSVSLPPRVLAAPHCWNLCMLFVPGIRQKYSSLSPYHSLLMLG